MTDDDGMPPEANRPDGKPARKPPAEAPSKKEVAAENRRYLAERGCTACGEDDPSVLAEYGIYLPSCPTVQVPPGPQTEVYCEACAPEASPFERFKQKHREMDRTYVLYECGNVAAAEEPEREPDPRSPDYGRTRAERKHAPIRCRCGSPVVEVLD